MGLEFAKDDEEADEMVAEKQTNETANSNLEKSNVMVDDKDDDGTDGEDLRDADESDGSKPTKPVVPPTVDEYIWMWKVRSYPCYLEVFPTYKTPVLAARVGDYSPNVLSVMYSLDRTQK